MIEFRKAWIFKTTLVVSILIVVSNCSSRIKSIDYASSPDNISVPKTPSLCKKNLRNTMSIKPLKIRKLVEYAKIHPANALHDGLYQSFPIPLGDSKIAFLYCPATLVYERGLKLYHPDYIATLNVVEFKLEMLRSLKQ